MPGEYALHFIKEAFLTHSFIQAFQFFNKLGIEYETSTNDIDLKIQDEKTVDNTPKANNGISNMLCGVLCKSRLDDVLNENDKQSDNTKNSTSQGIFSSNAPSIAYFRNDS